MTSRKAYGYYHGVVLKRIAARTKRDPRDLHRFFTKRFNPVRLTVGDHTEVIGGSMKALDPQQARDFVDRVRQFAEVELGLVIPAPDPERTR